MKIKLNIPQHGDGDMKSFINKPFIHKEQAIGIIQEVNDCGDTYELTVFIWDRFVDFFPSYDDGKFSAVSFEFK